jgi:hypothetical protein
VPIIRTYICLDCNQQIEVTLRASEWNIGPPPCPVCSSGKHPGQGMQQQFKPVAIGGSALARAAKAAEKIAEEDYGVANMSTGRHEGEVPKVTYKDSWQPQPTSSTWGANGEAMGRAIQAGIQNRRENGSWLDHNQQLPDLIAASKRRSGRVW